MEKTCHKCKIKKRVELFYKDKKHKDGLQSRCKECHNKDVKESSIKNPKSRKENSKKFYEKNKEYLKKKSKLYRDNNPEIIKNYYKKNRETIKAQQKKYKETNSHKNKTANKRSKINFWQANKRKTDILFKIRGNIRSLISQCIIKQGFSKNTKTYNILGCTYDEFKTHIESKWDSWMNWDNYGAYRVGGDRTWNIDHKIPMASAKTEIEAIYLNNYLNLGPLCSKENLQKSSKSY